MNIKHICIFPKKSRIDRNFSKYYQPRDLICIVQVKYKSHSQMKKNPLLDSLFKDSNIKDIFFHENKIYYISDNTLKVYDLRSGRISEVVDVNGDVVAMKYHIIG